MTHPLTGQPDLVAGHADQGIRVAALSQRRISKEQLAAAERARLYHVNKLAFYKAPGDGALVPPTTMHDAAGAQA